MEWDEKLSERARRGAGRSRDAPHGIHVRHECPSSRRRVAVAATLHTRGDDICLRRERGTLCATSGYRSDDTANWTCGAATVSKKHDSDSEVGDRNDNRGCGNLRCSGVQKWRRHMGARRSQLMRSSECCGAPSLSGEAQTSS